MSFMKEVLEKISPFGTNALPRRFRLAAERLGVAPEQCLVFDNVLPAVKSAKQAGMLVCGVYDKYSAHHRTEIEQIADGYLIDFKDAPLLMMYGNSMQILNYRK